MSELPNPQAISDQELPRDPLDAGLAIAFGSNPAAPAAVPCVPRPEPTGDYRGSAAPGEPVRRVTMALVGRPMPHLTSEVQALLRKRLRIIALVMATLPGFGTVRALLTLVLGSTHDIPWLLFQSTLAATLAVFATILWTKRVLSLTQLRLMELFLFGFCVAVATFFDYTELSETHFMVQNPGSEGMLADQRALMWVLLIVAYGIFIPNTWRRCAISVGVMALMPLVVGAAGGLSNPNIPHRSLFWYLTGMSSFLGLSVLIAVFGSGKISRLQQEAFAARQLGQYQLKQRLGAGGMGDVYLAEHLLLRRPCALKLIRPERAGDPHNLLRFEREVQATAKLTHWNTVEIYDYGHTEDGTFYYAMEYLPGLNLEQLVERYGPLPPERAVHFLRQVCGALQEAHTTGLIHRDLKPSNIIACERGGIHDVAKLVDFGLVQSYGLMRGGAKLTQEGTLAGTPAYMSPEQIDENENLDARSDIYSLGGLAYFLLTGKPPFVRKTAIQTLAAHLHEPVRVLTATRPDIPADLQDVVLRCLEKDAAKRFPDAGSLEQALAQCSCAEQWTRGRAAAWWQRYAETKASQNCLPEASHA